MLKEIPKDTSFHGNQHKGNVVMSSTSDNTKTKETVAKELGFTRNQVSQFQRMADHEDVVQKAIVEARENDDIISRNAVLKKIEEEQKPHVAFNTGNNEWYTPKEYIELARLVMGSIDCDPASCDVAQETVQAGVYYTEETNGLDKDWDGNVWMNPPYATGLIEKFCEKVAEEYMSGNTEQAVVLVNNATETSWFKSLVSCASAVCFPHGRIRFMTASGKAGAPLQGQAFVYFGDNVEKFISEFQNIGWCAEVR
jgi:phage N-6-adenine-methyltransferase